jgi:mono/diheme cytochrome c family protein/nitrate/TMAO reductase-like tetraheme cytochrome c subunit
MKKLRERLKMLGERLGRFFYPPADSPRWLFVLPYVTLGILGLLLLSGGVYGWEYTNSSKFCGTACHTMPPQDVAYKESPHANVTCEECHIGRASFINQLTRKSQGLHETYYMIFKLYEYPIRAKALRPARDTCEKCHMPETFSDDSLRVISHYADDLENTQSSIYLIMKTGGGAKREGLGRGIHWHIVNKVEYYTTDELSQNIPYVRVYNDDGTTTEYVDVESGFDKATLEESQLKEVSCVTCHNRITHEFPFPTESVDEALARGQISPAIPEIRKRSVSVLSVKYDSREVAFTAINALENYYKGTDYYADHEAEVTSAIQAIKDIYDGTVFHDQEVDWETHPNNLGHINSPGCFRCHDGKHLNAEQEAIRLECNVCHSIPVVVGKEDFVTNIEISRGLEPESHRNPNWISLHNQVFDQTCSSCHATDDPGGTSNTSFCSNSACHGSVFTYAGFDAPKLREILQAQLPTPVPAESFAPIDGTPIYDANIAPMLSARCGACHGDTATAGLNVITYADLMKGGKSGPVVLAGDSAGSLIVQVQSKQHFANLSEEELQLLIQWIDAGAPEK